MTILAWIVVGIIAGWLAKTVMPGTGPGGILGGLIVGGTGGVLVVADVYQAGVGIGGQYGEGALRIRGKTVAYYSITSASIGFQLGGQKKDIILGFLQAKALP